MRTRILILGLLFGGLVTLLLYGGLALAQYPTKPISVLVGYPPGGTVDLTARFLSNLVQESLGKAIAVENKPGASSLVALAAVASAKPDGYTLVFSPSQGVVLVPHTLKTTVSYKDFTPIVSTHLLGQGFCAMANDPLNTFREFIDYARKHPGTIYGHAGKGSSTHITPLYIAKKEGIQLKDLPFNGGAATVAALLGGHVRFISGSGTHVTYVKEGKFKMLAVYTPKRSKYTSVPTIFELGYDEIPRNPAHILLAPKGIPEDVKKTLEKAFTDAIHSKAFADFLDKIDADLGYANSTETEKQIEEDYGKWGNIIKDLGLVVGKS